MDGILSKINKLTAVGDKFTYENFSEKSEYGYPSSLTVDWITWTTRVRGAINGLFAPDSAPAKLILDASKIKLIGYEHKEFQQVKAHYMGALNAASSILSEDTFGELIKQEVAIAPKDLTNKVFIVHGHDDKAKAELEVLLTEIGLEPVVLHRQADGGRTIIEKFEDHADVGFAFILLTPDEVAYLAGDEEKPDIDRKKEKRARPNVIFEFGYFVGRLSRKRTCCLYRGDVVLPSDLNGLIYKHFDKSVEEVGYQITKELKAAGYKLR